MASGSHGFSLVELMVVIGIMGILSTMAIPNYLKSARRQMAITQMRAMSRGIQAIRASEDRITSDISQSWCSACYCWGKEKTEACRKVMDATLKKLNFNGAIKDPWGGYYMIDENESEFAYAPGRNDILMAYNADDNTYLVVTIPNYTGLEPYCAGEWFCSSPTF